MFKLVPTTLPDGLKALVSPSVVDLQLVGDELANDVTFTWDRSVKKDASTTAYTYTALHEVVAPEGMHDIRSLVYLVLSRLVDDVRFMCFMTGRAASDGVRELENCVMVEAHHEDLEMNGRVGVAVMDRDDLELGMSHWGHFDGMRGAALTARGLAGMYADLRLFEPLPTTSNNIWFQPPRYDAIQTTLKHSVFFFEEINNGTRLRIVSTEMSQAELEGKIEALLREWGEGESAR